MPTISIIIPTYTRSDKLNECLRSIYEYCDPSMCSVVVVANGAAEDTRHVYNAFEAQWAGEAELLWFDEPMGYPRPVNAGIRAAMGNHNAEYVVLLNDDAEFLPQPRNECIDVMLKPMLEDDLVGLTGPLEEYDPNSDRRFLIFFCVMIRCEVFGSIGMLDETFRYFGEDTDFSIRATAVGWKVVRVPEEYPTELKPLDPNTTTLEPWKHDLVHTGNFKIFHDAESTIGHLPDSEVVLRESRAILKERYGKKEVNTPTANCEKCGTLRLDGVCVPCLKEDEGIDIFEASVTDGWFGVDECAQIARWVKALPPNSVVVEVGSWHGRSSRAIAANLSKGSRLFCVDTWIGSSGEPEMHGTAHYDRGDHALSWWMCNLWKYINTGQVIPIRAHSENAAHTLGHLGLKIDLLFIDADHSLEGFQTDVAKWAPLMKEEALWCGHDYYPEGTEPFAWIGVREGVQGYFPDAQKVATSLWWSRSKPRIKRTVIDCIPFNDEILLLQARFAELDSVVDRFVITEAPLTHSGKPKPLHFKENIELFALWLHKITHIVVDDFDHLSHLKGPDRHWAIERHQRDSLIRGLTECKDDDVIIISDTDEIPKAEAIANYRTEQGLCCLEMRLFYCYINNEAYEPWRWTRLLPYGLLKQNSPCWARYVPNYEDSQLIKNGGWHFSFMGGPDAWVQKLEDSPHQEYNLPELKDKELMQRRALNGEDILGREARYRFVPLDGSYPKFITDNLQQFKDNNFIGEAVMHPESNRFIESVKQEHPDFFVGKKVLEVGSLDVNGSVRQFFQDCKYHGIDLGEGPSVDEVTHVLQVTDFNGYDVVISSEALEHDKQWRESLKHMHDLLKPGGLLILTCAGPKRPEHGTTRTDTYSSPFTTDYYRNISQEDLKEALPTSLFSICVMGYERGGKDLNFWGLKQPETQGEYIERKAEEFINASPLSTIPGNDPSIVISHSKRWTVTAEISTKDRYFTTLPLTISAIATQSAKPDELVIYDDGEQLDLREVPPYNGLLKMLDEQGIKWAIRFTPREGQVRNHQDCLDTAETDFIWRIDDDEVPMPDCLERLLNAMRDYGRGGEFENIGAVAGLVHHPGNVTTPPDFLDGSLNDVTAGLNLQWFNWNSGPREVEHLYSTFLYRVEAGRKAGGYPKGLSVVGHREETIFSHAIRRAGYKLLIEPAAKTFHLREPKGGIRSFTDVSLWEKDERIFQSYLQEWGANPEKPSKLIVLDNGLGDHFSFKSILPKLKEIHADKELILAVCYPDVFRDEGLKLISIADAKNMLGDRYPESHAYKHFWDVGNGLPIAEAMLRFWS